MFANTSHVTIAIPMAIDNLSYQHHDLWNVNIFQQNLGKKYSWIVFVKIFLVESVINQKEGFGALALSKFPDWRHN